MWRSDIDPYENEEGTQNWRQREETPFENISSWFDDDEPEEQEQPLQRPPLSVDNIKRKDKAIMDGTYKGEEFDPIGDIIPPMEDPIQLDKPIDVDTLTNPPLPLPSEEEQMDAWDYMKKRSELNSIHIESDSPDLYLEMMEDARNQMMADHNEGKIELPMKDYLGGLVKTVDWEKAQDMYPDYLDTEDEAKDVITHRYKELKKELEGQGKWYLDLAAGFHSYLSDDQNQKVIMATMVAPELRALGIVGKFGMAVLENVLGDTAVGLDVVPYNKEMGFDYDYKQQAIDIVGGGVAGAVVGQGGGYVVGQGIKQVDKLITHLKSPSRKIGEALQDLVDSGFELTPEHTRLKDMLLGVIDENENVATTISKAAKQLVENDKPEVITMEDIERFNLQEEQKVAEDLSDWKPETKPIKSKEMTPEEIQDVEEAVGKIMSMINDDPIKYRSSPEVIENLRLEIKEIQKVKNRKKKKGEPIDDEEAKVLELKERLKYHRKVVKDKAKKMTPELQKLEDDIAAGKHPQAIVDAYRGSLDIDAKYKAIYDLENDIRWHGKNNKRVFLPDEKGYDKIYFAEQVEKRNYYQGYLDSGIVPNEKVDSIKERIAYHQEQIDRLVKRAERDKAELAKTEDDKVELAKTEDDKDLVSTTVKKSSRLDNIDVYNLNEKELNDLMDSDVMKMSREDIAKLETDPNRLDDIYKDVETDGSTKELDSIESKEEKVDKLMDCVLGGGK